MRYFKFTSSTPYCGTEHTTYEYFHDDVTEKELEDYADEEARQCGESFEYLVVGWDNDEFDDEEEREQALEDFYADCYCTYEEISYEQYREEA
jgi:hypothetical protein